MRTHTKGENRDTTFIHCPASYFFHKTAISLVVNGYHPGTATLRSPLRLQSYLLSTLS